MEHKIILRKLLYSDLKSLENVIRKTWNYDKFTAPKTAKRLAKVYLSTCLTNQTYSRVTEINGVPAGVIFGKNIKKHHCLLKYRWWQITALYQLFISKEGREILNFYKSVNNNQLLKQCLKDDRGEISLFALVPEYRSLGIGKSYSSLYWPI